MSLMRLLTAGKSWGGGKDTTVRYQMTDPRAMPKFGAGKNPFRSTANARPAPAETQPSSVPRDSVAEQFTRVGARSAPVRRSQESEATSALLPERCQQPGAVRAGTVRAPDISGLREEASSSPDHLGTLALVRTALERVAALVLRRRAGSVAPRVARFEKAPIQGELSLEKIKVARNDLSDADLEVVPAKAPAAQVRSEPGPHSRPLSEPIAEGAAGALGARRATTIGER